MHKCLLMTLNDFKYKGISSAIVPFGFELLDTYNVHPSLLRRIYLYVKSNDNSELLTFVQCFSKYVKKLYPEIGDRISTVKLQGSTVSIGNMTDNYVQIYISRVVSTETLLDTYADYINLSSKYIANRSHPQLLKYNTHPASRSYILQLFLMSLKLTATDKYSEEITVIRKIIRESNISWGKPDMRRKPNNIEAQILNDAIIPFFCDNEKKISTLCNEENTINLQCEALHGKVIFNRDTPASLINEYRRFTAKKYMFLEKEDVTSCSTLTGL